MQKVTLVRVVGCDLCGVVQHLHQVLLVGAARLPGRSVARAAPEGVPGLEVLRLCLLIGLLAGVSLSLLLLHLAAELSPVLLLVFLDTKSASSPLTHTDLAVPRLDRLLGGVLGDVRAGQPRVLHVARHRVLARIPSRLGLDQRSQFQSDLAGDVPVLLQPLVFYLRHLPFQRLVLPFLDVKLPLSGVSRRAPALSVISIYGKSRFMIVSYHFLIESLPCKSRFSPV